MSLRNFNAILAHSNNYGIGKNGTIPWQLPADMKFFKKITSGYGILPFEKETRKNVVIMGRKTWESLPEKARPLKDRINIVLTSKPSIINGYDSKNLKVCNSLDNALSMIDADYNDIAKNTFVIGGQKVYEEGLHHKNCKEVFVTRLGIDFDCDTFVDKSFFKNYKHLETSATKAQNGIPYDFQRLIQNHYYEEKYARQFDDQHEEFQYLNTLKELIDFGRDKDDRTGVGTFSKFGQLSRYNLGHTFPLLTTKNVFWRGVVEELLWFIRADTNAKNLSDKKVHIWDANGSREFLDNLGLKDREEGDLGPVYGFQWRHFGAEYQTKDTDYSGKGVDQLKNIINTLKTNPDSRRMILTAWNPAALHLMALPPCHTLSQFYVQNGKLSCLMYQRSCDTGLGVPFNIASYALLTCMLAQVTGLKRGEFVHVYGDYHIYKNHVEPLKKQIQRIPKPFPILDINPDISDIDSFKTEDFKLIGYNYHPRIKMDMAV